MFLEIEELHFCKGSRATFVCPLSLEGGKYVPADEAGPANLEEAIKVVYFYKGSDSLLPLVTFDNRDGALFKTSNSVTHHFKTLIFIFIFFVLLFRSPSKQRSDWFDHHH